MSHVPQRIARSPAAIAKIDSQRKTKFNGLFFFERGDAESSETGSSTQLSPSAAKHLSIHPTRLPRQIRPKTPHHPEMALLPVIETLSGFRCRLPSPSDAFTTSILHPVNFAANRTFSRPSQSLKIAGRSLFCNRRLRYLI